MSQTEIITAIKMKNESPELIEAIDSLPHIDRITIREQCKDIPTPRNLWFDYKLQQWID